MKGRISDEQRIVHILDAINEIATYTSGLDFTDFKQNSMAKFATVKQLEIIGEASKNISSEMRLTYPSVGMGSDSRIAQHFGA